jgi:hypothetical protein
MEAARGLILWFWGYVMQVTAGVDYQVPSVAGEAARGPIGGDRANRGGLSRDLTQGEGASMTIVSLVAIHPNPGVKWVDLQKQIKKACDLARKHGAENVTVLATMIGGAATNTIGVLSSAEDWTRFGQIQQAFLDDPATQIAMLEGAEIATWETYVCQTIPGM